MLSSSEFSSKQKTTLSSSTLGMVMPVEALTRKFALPARSDGADASDTTAVLVSDLSEQLQSAQQLASGAIFAGQEESAPQSSAVLDQSAQATQVALENIQEQRQGFLVGQIGLMISYEDGSELVDMPELYHLPNAPAWFVGLVNLHGNMIPVFDLAVYLGVGKSSFAIAQEKKADDSSLSTKLMLLVLAHGEDAAGVVVHGIPQRLYLSGQKKMAPDVAPDSLLPHVTDAYLMEQQMWFDLQCDSLLHALEQSIQTG